MNIPLPTDEPHIRLITDVYRDYNDTINLQIEVVSLKRAAATYSAISYTWGSDENLQQIRVNGASTLCRENIYNFFQHYLEFGVRPELSKTQTEIGLVRLERPCRLWVDSICINQNDIQEKNGQVRMMGRIFGEATDVCAWLGSSASCSSELADRFHKYWCRDASIGRGWHSFLKDLNEREPFRRDDKLWMQFFDIWHSSYWERLWIVQELLLAKRAYIIHGSYKLATPCLADMLSFKRHIDIVLGLMPKKLDRQFVPRDQILYHLTCDTTHNEPMTHVLSDLFYVCRWQLCTDPKDKVYGLIGATRFAKRFDIDYAKPLEAIVLQAIHVVISELADLGRRHTLDSSRVPKIKAILQATHVTPLDLLSYLSKSCEASAQAKAKRLMIELELCTLFVPYRCTLDEAIRAMLPSARRGTRCQGLEYPIQVYRRETDLTGSATLTRNLDMLQAYDLPLRAEFPIPDLKATCRRHHQMLAGYQIGVDSQLLLDLSSPENVRCKGISTVSTVESQLNGQHQSYSIMLPRSAELESWYTQIEVAGASSLHKATMHLSLFNLLGFLDLEARLEAVDILNQAKRSHWQRTEHVLLRAWGLFTTKILRIACCKCTEIEESVPERMPYLAVQVARLTASLLP